MQKGSTAARYGGYAGSRAIIFAFSAEDHPHFRIWRMQLSFEQKRELTASEVQQILESINGCTEEDLRDRALIALIFNFVRLSEALEMRVGDIDLKQLRLLVPIRKGCFQADRHLKIHQCSKSLANMLAPYVGKRGAGAYPNAPLFPSSRKHQHPDMSSHLSAAEVNSMIRRRGAAAGVLVDVNSLAIRKATYSLTTGARG
jgi:site-specific recombinase XerD